MNEVRFSILVHARNTDLELFREMLRSVYELNYMNYELIVLDSNSVALLSGVINEITQGDGRITYKSLSHELNDSESYNIGLRMMSGDYLCIIGQYDCVAADWLEKMERVCISSLIPEKRNIDFNDLTKAASGGRLRQWKITAPDVIYTDYDEIIEGTRMNPHFLGAFNPELLLQYDYIGSGMAISMGLLRKLRFFDESLSVGELYEYKLRMLEYYRKTTDARYPSHNFDVIHCSGLLYHKRIRDIGIDRKRIYDKRRYETETTLIEKYLSRNYIHGNLSKDKNYVIHPLKRKGSDFISKKKDYILIKDKNVRVMAQERATSRMYGHLKQWDVAVVGGKFVSGSKIVNCGYIYDENGIIYPACYGQRVSENGYGYRISLAQDVSMVDPGFCMMDASIYKKLGGLRPGMLKRDAMLEYCLRVQQAGYRIIYDPNIVVHVEDMTPESSEQSHNMLMSLYGPNGSNSKIRIENGDPFYNPYLPAGVENYRL
jgi:glycosyltransferase involved in cell wall biosynthesis